jgi:hypothetical protein
MKDEYLSFIQLLNEHQIEYVVLGGVRFSITKKRGVRTPNWQF